jgi:hypothetical protein
MDGSYVLTGLPFNDLLKFVVDTALPTWSIFLEVFED